MNKDHCFTVPSIIFFGISLAIVACSNLHPWLNSTSQISLSLEPFGFLQNIDAKAASKCFIVLLTIISLLIAASTITSLIFSFAQNDFSSVKNATFIGVFSFLAFSLLSSDILLHWIFSKTYLSDSYLILATSFSAILAVILTFYVIFNIGLFSSMLLSSSKSIVSCLHFLGLLFTTALVLSLVFNIISQKTLDILF